MTIEDNGCRRISGRELVMFMEDSFEELSDYGGIVGMATENSLTVHCDMVECTSPGSSRAKSFRPGRYEWSMTIARLYVDKQNGLGDSNSGTGEIKLLQAGQAVCVGFGLSDEDWDNLFDDESTRFNQPHKRCYGTAYIEEVNINAPVNGRANYRVSLKGTGDLQADNSIYHSVPPPRP